MTNMKELLLRRTPNLKKTTNNTKILFVPHVFVLKSHYDKSKVKFKLIGKPSCQQDLSKRSIHSSISKDEFPHTVNTQLPLLFLPIIFPTFAGTKEQIGMYWLNSAFTEALFEYKLGTIFIALLPTAKSVGEWECLTHFIINKWDWLNWLVDNDHNKKVQLPIWYHHFMKSMNKFEYACVIPPLRTAG